MKNDTEFSKHVSTCVSELMDALVSNGKEAAEHLYYASEQAQQADEIAFGTTQFVIALDLLAMVERVKRFIL